jgi:hypothetical protein
MLAMALVDLTRQIAAQTLGNSVKDILDPEKPGAPVQPEKLHAIILGQIQAMQKALKEDQELVILLNTAAGSFRILEIYVPSQQLFVLTGIDADKNVTRILSPVASTQLVCKTMKVAQPILVKIVVSKSI